MMVLCGFCDEWQHGACFGMTDEYCVPELHVCEACAAKVYMCSTTITNTTDVISLINNAQ